MLNSLFWQQSSVTKKGRRDGLVGCDNLSITRNREGEETEQLFRLYRAFIIAFCWNGSVLSWPFYYIGHPTQENSQRCIVETRGQPERRGTGVHQKPAVVSLRHFMH